MTHAEHWASFRESRAHFDRFPTADNGAVVLATYRAYIESAEMISPAEAAELCQAFERTVATKIARAAA